MPATKRLVEIVLVPALFGVLSTRCPGDAPADPRARESEIVALVRDHFLDARTAREWVKRNEHFAKGARDEATFAALANRALGELKTSHTGYFDRREPEYYALRSIFSRTLKTPAVELDSPGADLTADNVVRVVFAGGPAERAGLRRGDEIQTADDKPFHRIDSFQGRAGKPVVLKVRRSRADQPVVLTLTPRRIDPKKEWLEAQVKGSRIIDVKGRKIGYVPMFSCAGNEFEEALIDALTGALRAADALVIDFRNGFGGCDPAFVNIFNRRPPVLTSIDRQGRETVMDAQWRKPVVLLINGGSRSGKEAVAAALKKHKLATLVGERTAGAVVAGRCFPLGNDAVLYLAVQDVRVDGERLEGVGVAPDIEVRDTLPYANGRDPQWERALDVAADR